MIFSTGALCVISQEITWLYNPQVRAGTPAPEGPRYDLIEEAVKGAFPAASIDSIHIDEPYLASRVRIRFSNEDRRTFYVNPYNGEVQGEEQGAGFRGFILALHGWLLFPWRNDYSLGWYLVTAFSIPLLGVLITAPLIVKRFWRHFYRPRLRLGKGGRAFWGDLHRLAGVWSFWFLIVISVSALWFLIQGVLMHNRVAIYPAVPELSTDAAPADTSAAETLSLAHLVNRAKSECPDLRITYIHMPEHPYAPVIVRGTRGTSLFRDNVNAVYLNPYSGEAVAIHSPGKVSSLHKTVALMAPLHFGDFGGLPSKLVWFFFGCLLCLSVYSGFVIWTKRTAASTTQLYRQQKLLSRMKAGKGQKEVGVKLVKWRGFAFVSWLVVLLPLYFFYQQKNLPPALSNSTDEGRVLVNKGGLRPKIQPVVEGPVTGPDQHRPATAEMTN